LGLMFNGILKIPMQFVILFIGVMVFVFYIFIKPPIYFNKAETAEVRESEYSGEMELLDSQHEQLFQTKREQTYALIEAIDGNDEEGILKIKEDIAKTDAASKEVKEQVKVLIHKVNPDASTRDTDYVFITFVMDHLPHGLIGILLAVIFSAAMSSSSSELNALASTTTVDLYKRSIVKDKSPAHYLRASKLITFLWGAFAILFATFASRAENLIQFVNIIGSIFYGTILGIFLIAFYIKKIQGGAAFWAAIITQLIVIYLYFFTDIAFLLYNIIGCVLVIAFASIFQLFNRTNRQ